jgi:hypothetical protein
LISMGIVWSPINEHRIEIIQQIFGKINLMHYYNG